MARNKEAVVLLLDVGPSMHSVLSEVESVCSMLVQKKLIFGKSDEVGVVLLGTDDTCNELQKEVGGYEHIVVLRNISVVDGNAVDFLQNLPRGNFRGDFIDAIVVGIDLLIKKFGPTNKGKQRICLMTDARYPIKAPYEGTKEDQVNTISQMMQTHGIRLDCIVIREKLPEADLRVMEENDNLLDQFSRKAIAKIVHVDSSTSLLGALKTRNISPVTVFRGDLELSSTMKIKVWVYKKTSEEKFPTLKKYSDKAPSSDKFATYEVKVDYEYKSMEDPDKVVPPEQRIRGYRYGPQVVPISSAEWEAVKFKPEKGVKLLGFTDASNILRHYYMKDVYIFVPEPGNKKAIVAVSAIARAMKDMNKSAILRCVWRQGQGNVVIGVLRPNISSVDNIPDSFYFNVLPFVEDVREFQFPSFSSFPSSWQPNEQQQEAADNLVKMLDLAPSSKEVLQPDYTPNPVLERFYHFLELKSKQPDADVPPLDGSLKRITEPNPAVFSHHKSVIDNFCKNFELKENPKKKKSSKRAWRGKPSTFSEKEEGVDDFEAMMARRDSSKWVSKAIKDMQNHVSDLLENSYDGDAYSKAIECLVALRKGCILEQEPKEFNRYLLGLYEKWKDTDLANFFELLSSKSLTLISQKEASDSNVTEEEAKNFPVKTELKF
ncbi:ATP-dependent DNA helicase 2 subunit KU80 isoform X2 [Phoenix dactylifera]|uniref:ATP-dependent DNA helicase 2 subunit KU80 n=1 Tax=Phoenix dactylifera TaxID=42345 RepID=A0A8B8J518_PHODC|nr:ATP-dependent DNA helicase 2 subunit KU80 isoform X2 [Phoenix dactylifera]